MNSGGGYNPKETIRAVADNVIKVRKSKKISQKSLSDLSGVSYGSVKRFEITGEISLRSLSKIANCLGFEKDLTSLFTKKEN